MNIQIFGKKKCFDTKKAERYFKERGIKFQSIDLLQKGLSKGEFRSVSAAVGGLENLIDEKSKDYSQIAYLLDEAKEEKLEDMPKLYKTPPIVRNGKKATVALSQMYGKGGNNLMRAYIYEVYGGAEVLKLTEVPRPIPTGDEVLVKIHAFCINDWDYHNLTGDMWMMRMFLGIRRPKVQILGCDVAGVVEAVGVNVTKFKVGDRVYGDLSNAGWGGAFAEYATGREVDLEHMAESMTFEDAAAIPQAGMLAYQGIMEVGRIKDGNEILINGAGGGVGTLAVQIARCMM